MTKRWLALVVSAVAHTAAMASLGLRVDIYSAPADGATVEADPLLVVIDVLIASNPGSERWTSGGVRVEMFNGATLRYAIDPNTGNAIPTNQGTANRCTTSFSRPRGRDSNNRFTNSGAAAAGRYCPTGPSLASLSTEVNVAYFASPPKMHDGPAVAGLAVFRAAVDLTGVGPTDSDVILKEPDIDGLPPDAAHPLLLARSYCANGSPGTVSATFTDPVTTGHDWSLWATPEPTPFVLLAVGGALAFRRR